VERSSPPPFHVERILQDAEGAGIPLLPDSAAKLVGYGALLGDRAGPLGLVSEADSDRLYERHVLDSLRAAALIPQRGVLVLDLGSGAGLPGMVLAIAQPGNAFTLAEPKTRAAGFLELAVDRLELGNVTVAVARAQELHTEVDVVTARAFGPIHRSWAAAVRLLRPGGFLVYFAGGRFSIGTARSLTVPERPGRVDMATVLENAPPLVMMSRTG
jgi:16S rRNA (guanine527-N7)-methyltransferase